MRQGLDTVNPFHQEVKVKTIMMGVRTMLPLEDNILQL